MLRMGGAVALRLPTPAWRSEGQSYLLFSCNYLPTFFLVKFIALWQSHHITTHTHTYCRCGSHITLQLTHSHTAVVAVTSHYNSHTHILPLWRSHHITTHIHTYCRQTQQTALACQYTLHVAVVLTVLWHLNTWL